MHERTFQEMRREAARDGISLDELVHAYRAQGWRYVSTTSRASFLFERGWRYYLERVRSYWRTRGLALEDDMLFFFIGGHGLGVSYKRRWVRF